ncbi:(2Fe-2S)-binding protein [Roseomonas xinghualingensis]|uniref:(2Fe-2S)-binding protein n=1 Tax=Roseomonas xinghualingensis TaxID=2986475 RepID=UPI0021F1A4CE|nr:(2Fe-2S)-binding protein [Roseomonas sp. SXEYE001]MCV4210105.1 (2Fe-2S)-binding protein [Roseomonas sp. SXEYE001]
MYVCICNGLTDTQIKSAISSGANRTHDVYSACNCRAQCGSCTASILCMLRSGRNEVENASQLPVSIAN